MRRFGKRMMNESNNPDHYSGDTFYIKRKDPDYGIYKVEINQDDAELEDIIGEIYKDWIPCAILRDDGSTLASMFDNSNVEDVVRTALESDSSNKKLYTIDWNVETTQPWINYDEVDLTDSEYEDVVNDIRNDEYIDFSVFNGNAIAFCDEDSISSLVKTIQHYMEYGSCYYNIEKMELDTDEESLVESEDESENDTLGGFIDDGDSVIDGIEGNWGDYDEIDEEDAIEELRAKADYEREEDDGMRESVMRSRLHRGRMIREGRRPRGRMLKEDKGSVGMQKFTYKELEAAWKQLVENVKNDSENQKYPPNGYDIRNGYGTTDYDTVEHRWEIDFSLDAIVKKIESIDELILFGDLEVYWCGDDLAEPDGHGIFIEDGKIKEVY